LLYHFDAAHRLEEGVGIELDRYRLSLFGRNYVKKFRQFGVMAGLERGVLETPLEHLDNSTFREYALEFFRLHHPAVADLKLPSRLCSFFATDSAEDAVRYAERYGYKGEIRVFEVHAAGEHSLLDMTWLDRAFPKKIDGDIAYYLNGYWRGDLFRDDPHLSGADPRPSLQERLVTSSIRVGRRVV